MPRSRTEHFIFPMIVMPSKEDVLIFEDERPDSRFQERFMINDEFYSAQQIRDAIKECFPETSKTPFMGLDYIQRREQFEVSRVLTHKRGVPRDTILAERIPEADTLKEGDDIHIFEKQRYRSCGEDYERQYGMMLEPTDCGYIINCFW